MDTNLSGRTALITGGGTGIGAGIALAMAAEGANVVVNYSRSKTEALAVVDQIGTVGAKAIAVRCDVSQSDDVERMFARAREEFQRVDILVNNAGQVFSKASTADISEEDWDRTFAVNLKGTFLCSQAAIRQMADGIGRIINISSISSCSGKGGPAYGPAKAAVNALTRDMAYELGSRGITVNAIAPGIIDTRIHQEGTPPDQYAKLIDLIPLKRDGKPADIAGIAVLLASEAGAYINGDVIHVNGGMLMQ
ncbi:MAG: glucose 1-dehydrogenase [Pirellulaceae bacterium]|nr:glucose 1-dehydrogenase [Pirellulaceae bacterium]